jgi:hypothetical protein
MVSRGGGTRPVWSRDSQSLYFRQDGKVTAVSGGPPFREREPIELFEAPWSLVEFDTAPDGRGFIMIRRAEPAAARLHVILNWADEVKRRVQRSTS